MNALVQEIAARLQHPALVVGVGNPDRGDDGAGILLAVSLSRIAPDACVVAGSAPENHLEAICRRRPRTVLFVDAVHMDAPPGVARLLPLDSIGGGALSSHALPLAASAEYLRQRCGAESLLIGIQPRHLAFRCPLSPEVADAVDRLCAALAPLLLHQTDSSPENRHARG